MAEQMKVQSADAVRVIGFYDPPENNITDVNLEWLFGVARPRAPDCRGRVLLAALRRWG